jgi:hypothetical protein
MNQNMNKESLLQCDLFNTKLFKEFYIDIFYNRQTYFDIFEFLNFIKNEKYFENIEMRYITKYLFDKQPYYYLDTNLNNYYWNFYVSTQLFTSQQNLTFFFDFQILDLVQNYLYDSNLFNISSFDFTEQLDSIIDEFFKIFNNNISTYDKFYDMMYNFFFVMIIKMNENLNFNSNQMLIIKDNIFNFFY